MAVGMTEKNCQGDVRMRAVMEMVLGMEGRGMGIRQR